MHRIILILLIALVFLYSGYRYKRLTPEQKKKAIKLVLIMLGGSLLGYLVLTGRLNWLIAAIGALIPLLPRVVRFMIGVAPTLLPFLRRYQQNKHSNMRTRYIQLQMNILTGELQGNVLKGRFAGQSIQSLSKEQLLELLKECRQDDQESTALLIAYLNRMHPGWARGADDQHSYTPHDSDMDLQEARDILGVTESSSKEDVIKAHKRLMQKMHPDRGGSDYLAQQINRARDKVLDSMA